MSLLVFLTFLEPLNAGKLSKPLYPQHIRVALYVTTSDVNLLRNQAALYCVLTIR